MRRLLLLLLLVGTLVFAAWQLIPKQLITQFTRPSKDIKGFLPQGSELTYPLTLPQGFAIGVFADLKGGLPRVLAIDPNGNVVASLTGQGKVVALPDADGNGQADKIVEILTGLNKPHGIAFDGSFIYVAETDKLIRAEYNPSSLSVGPVQKLFELPGGGRHFTRTIGINGGKLYTSVGSSCDTCVETQPFRASILVSNLDGSGLRVFARGLRNTVFFAFDAQGRMWGTDMGRDFLGDNLPPDEINLIEDGKDYGWPYCYGAKVRDAKFKPGEQTSYCSATQEPVYQLPAHVAPLGLSFDGAGDLLVGLHGSWNSSTPVGYKIVKLPVLGGFPTGSEDYITGWLNGKEVLGRPVDLIFDRRGHLLISDDKAGLIYILAKN